jgi:hypothetical protein
MDSFSVLFPELLATFSSELEAAGNVYLANELRGCRVRCVNYDAHSNAATITLASPRDLNVIERRVIGEHYETSIPVSSAYAAHVDVDNFDRALSIEILAPPAELRAKLSAMLASNNRWSGRNV